jgi:expansin (peptidoglycan-binding protein)
MEGRRSFPRDDARSSRLLPSLAFAAMLLAACGSESPASREAAAVVQPRTDTAGTCDGICDATVPSTPLLTDTVSWGDVTTYGGVGNANPSSGGACNYGVTGIYRYAAIQVNRLPGDLRGQWDGGRICGQCAKVEARTAAGWKSTIVRIVDKCPDDHCGIDLGGAPATDLMAAQAGRYSGRWTFVACPALEGISDGPVSFHVKTGSNRWWSLVQVRNPPAAVDSMVVSGSGAWGDSVWVLPWAVEAENFFKMPLSILTDSVGVSVSVRFRDGSRRAASLPGWVFSRQDTTIPF